MAECNADALRSPLSSGAGEAQPLLVARREKRQLWSDGVWTPWPQRSRADSTAREESTCPPWHVSCSDLPARRSELRQALRALEHARRLMRSTCAPDEKDAAVDYSMAQYHAIAECHPNPAAFPDVLHDSKYAVLETRGLYLRTCILRAHTADRLFSPDEAHAAGDWSSDDSEEGGDSFDGGAEEEDEEENNGGDADDGAGPKPWCKPAESITRGLRERRGLHIARAERLPPRQVRAVAPGGNCASDSDSDDARSTSRSPCTLPACSPQEGSTSEAGGFGSAVASSCGFCPHDGTCRGCQRQAQRESRLVWYRPAEGEASAKRAKLTDQSVHASAALAAHNVSRSQLAELTSALFDARYCATSQLTKARQELAKRACETAAIETSLREEHRRLSGVAAARGALLLGALEAKEAATAAARRDAAKAAAAAASAEAERAAFLQAAEVARQEAKRQRERLLLKAEKRATARQHAAVRLLLRPLPLYSMYSRQRVELLHGDELAMLTAHFERSVARHRGPAHADPHRRAPMLRVRQIERLHSPRLQQKYLAEVQDIAGLCNQSVAPLANVDAVPVQSFEGLELNERLMCVPCRMQL